MYLPVPIIMPSASTSSCLFTSVLHSVRIRSVMRVNKNGLLGFPWFSPRVNGNVVVDVSLPIFTFPWGFWYKRSNHPIVWLLGSLALILAHRMSRRIRSKASRISTEIPHTFRLWRLAFPSRTPRLCAALEPVSETRRSKLKRACYSQPDVCIYIHI